MYTVHHTRVMFNLQPSLYSLPLPLSLLCISTVAAFVWRYKRTICRHIVWNPGSICRTYYLVKSRVILRQFLITIVSSWHLSSDSQSKVSIHVMWHLTANQRCVFYCTFLSSSKELVDGPSDSERVSFSSLLPWDILAIRDTSRPNQKMCRTCSVQRNMTKRTWQGMLGTMYKHSNIALNRILKGKKTSLDRKKLVAKQPKMMLLAVNFLV